MNITELLFSMAKWEECGILCLEVIMGRVLKLRRQVNNLFKQGCLTQDTDVIGRFFMYSIFWFDFILPYCDPKLIYSVSRALLLCTVKSISEV